ncbi:MAG: hypothetical protein QM726_10920 [Chitinophagaceae bacterium]
MITQIISTAVLIILSIKSITFLEIYITLMRFGSRTTGKIIAFEVSRHIMIRGLVPKVEFQTDDNQSIIAKPKYSWFLELNNYLPGKTCVVYYDKNNANKFVLKSNIEFLTNFLIVIAALISLTWLILVLV